METAVRETSERDRGLVCGADDSQISSRTDVVKTLANELLEIERSLQRINDSF